MDTLSPVCHMEVIQTKMCAFNTFGCSHTRCLLLLRTPAEYGSLARLKPCKKIVCIRVSMCVTGACVQTANA